MKRLLVFLVIGLAALQGCVEFERETIVWRHDPVRDELRMLMIYEGIFSEGNIERSRKELRSVLLRPRTFLFSNWVLEYDRDAVLDWRSDLHDDKDEIPPDTYAASVRLIDLVLENVFVDNGSFYLNQANKLAGYQQATIRNVAAIATAANQLINTALIDDELGASDISLGSASEGMIQDAAYADHEWITLYEGELRLRFPVAPADYSEFVLERADDDDWHALIEGGMRETYVVGILAVVFGQPWASTTTTSVAVDDGPYEANLLEFVEEEGWLEPHPDFDAIVRRYVDREW